MVVGHRDREHAHIQLLVNRVHPERLRAWNNSHDYRRIERSLQRQERGMKLREVPGHHYRLPGQDRPERAKGQISGERREVERTGGEPWTERVGRATDSWFPTFSKARQETCSLC
jgi:hypothetical protein